jgi:carbonic anhydrase
MATAIQKNLEAASEKYSSTFTQGSLALPPAKKYLVLTCMDARIDPAAAFGIELGDAHVIRNVFTLRFFSDSRVERRSLLTSLIFTSRLPY